MVLLQFLYNNIPDLFNDTKSREDDADIDSSKFTDVLSSNVQTSDIRQSNAREGRMDGHMVCQFRAFIN